MNKLVNELIAKSDNLEAFEARQLTNRSDFVKALKKALQREFPNVKFSVRGSTGTAYSWIHIKSELSREAIRPFLKPWDTQDDDVMTDYAGSGYKLSYSSTQVVRKCLRCYEALEMGDDLICGYHNLEV